MKILIIDGKVCLRQNIAGWCQQTFCFQKFVDNTQQCTEVRFANFLSGRFITAIVVNPPERKLYCNPLQGNYRVEFLHREIPVVIPGNEFTECNFLLFWLHWNCCSISCNVYRELPIHITGFEGLLWYPVIFTGLLQGRITTQGCPCSHYREWVCSVAKHTSVQCFACDGIESRLSSYSFLTLLLPWFQPIMPISIVSSFPWI